MASIQVLELSPVEAQIEELSYDMTDSIRGGGLQEFVVALDACLEAFGAILDAGDPVEASAFLVDCLIEVALPALAA